ncbi:MFS transporter [Pelagibius sp. Alg239-R121]|uniref:MFS transporter n=1 Tax=Pelagibius sp. Alg239-R121 TaxID=2993448 RepID=UPI0024A68D0E|nr:MFS transporter [Pelagibius sp. Alg239-R121]
MGRLFTCIFIDLLGFGLIVPLLTFMALRFDASPLEVTAMIASYSLMQLFAAPLWGRASDRWGRKPVLLISFAATTTAFLMLAFAQSFWVLVAARALAGALSGDLSAAPAYVADITTPERRAKGMGLLGAAFALSFIVGASFGGYLSELNVTAMLFDEAASGPDYFFPPLLSASLSMTAFFFALFFLPESHRVKSREERAEETEAARKEALGRSLYERMITTLRALHYPHLALVTAILFLVGFVFAHMESTLALWADIAFGWDAREVGYLFAFAGVIAVIFQAGLLGPLTRRFGEARLVVFSAILLGGGMALVPSATGLVQLLVAIACLAAGFGLGNPSIQSLITKLSRPEIAGVALGMGQAASSLARVIGPLWAGFLFQRIGPDWPYIAGAFFMALVFVLAERLRRQILAGGATGAA